MYHYLILTLTLILLSKSIAFAEPVKLALSVNAEAAILINADTGAILYEKNIHKPYYPASITKIATGIYSLQNCSDKFDELITADQDCVGSVTEEAFRRSNYTLPSYLLIPGASHIGIKKGEILSFRDLFYGMMVASGDDAANIIAKFSGGTIPQFVDGLNAYMKQIGCLNTVFYNPHGLHHPKQVTTAYDMAILMREALKNPQFCDAIQTVRYIRPKTNKQESSILTQSNKLMRKGPFHYPKAIGGKTGYYSLAGSTFVVAAKDGDRTLIAVLMKTSERKYIFLDSKMMFEAAFNQPKLQRTLAKQGPQKFARHLEGAKKAIQTYIKEDVTFDYFPAEEPNIKCLLVWDQTLKLPVAMDQHVGELVFQAENGKTIAKAPLYAQNLVEATWIERVQSVFSLGNSPGYSKLVKVLAGLVFIVFIGAFALQLRQKKR